MDKKIYEEMKQKIDNEIKDLESQLKHLLLKKQLLESQTGFFLTYDSMGDEVLIVAVGMTFSNKYGERGIIRKIGENQKVVGLNLETNEEEEFCASRFTSCEFV
jgi:hypothetical protein